MYNWWVFDYVSYIVLFNWVELGNGLLVTMAMGGDIMMGCLVGVMVTGALIVVLFVYVEMWDDKEGGVFVVLLLMFLVCMGVLLLSANLLVFYLGWEGIGMISCFLVSFWSERVRSVKATIKVFAINKVGDCVLLYLMCVLVGQVGSLDFGFVEGWAVVMVNRGWACGSVGDMIAIGCVLGGGVKSVQCGFHVWLLEAMEAPLGASALMHSSTLVIAGIVLVMKLYSVVVLSWVAVSILLVWGSWTACFAAFVACFQYELKAILAYSTISSMGFIYMLLGLGAMYEVFLYLVVHAIVKIFLFLVVGLIMMYCNNMQDIR